ncbi:MAG: S8 family serine peptidase [Slackia sp.]|nr:S8 family serine peptidase [Slackia sp.]
MRTAAFPRNERRHCTRNATAALLSCTLALSGFALPARAACADDASRAEGPQSAAPRVETVPHGETPADGLLIFAEADAGIDTLSADGAANDALTLGLDAAGIEEQSRFVVAEDEVAVTAQPADGQSLDEALSAAASIDGVTAVQPNYVYELIDAVEEPEAGASNTAEGAELLARLAANDPFARISDPNERNNQYWLYQANFDDAWNRTTTDGDAAIAVFDTGVMAAHEDLGANVLTEYAWDSYENAPLYADGQNAFNGFHGTAVAGAAAAVANNGFGMAGASFNAKIVPVKVCDDNAAKPKTTSASLIRAYEHLFTLAKSTDANVRVVNMSLGSYSKSMLDKDETLDKGLEEQIERAKNEYGIVTVCAGGNGNQVDTPNTKRLYPADLDACVSVTALEPDGTNIVWSDYNEYKDIGAPGRAITAPLASDAGGTAAFTRASGSSLSAPIVSAAFALMFAAEPNATVDEATAALYAAACPIDDPENDRSGSGSHGSLDADAALEYLEAHHSPFADVSAVDCFYAPISYVHERGVMNGHHGIFEPEKPLTRAQAAQVFYNYLGNGAGAHPAELSDVDQSQWYAPSVNWAVETGVMKGLSGTGTFGVDDPLSREQLAIIIARIADADLAAADRSAFDALPDHGDTHPWALEEMIWATDIGIINGKVTPEGAFLVPLETVTRAQMAQVMMNALESGLMERADALEALSVYNPVR